MTTDLRDQPAGRHERDEDHCLHWQEGDGDCCGCGKPKWCPDGGEDEAVHIPDGRL